MAQNDGRWKKDSNTNRETGPKGPFGNLPKGPDDGEGKGPFKIWRFRLSLGSVAALVAVLYLVSQFMGGKQSQELIDYSDFKARIVSGEIRRVGLQKENFIGYTTGSEKSNELLSRVARPGQNVYRTVPLYDPDFVRLLDEKGVSYFAVPNSGFSLFDILLWIFPFVLFFVVWRFMMKRLGNMGGNVLSFGQNKAVIVAEGDIPVRFGDVAGVDEAKEELVEVIDFLKFPKKYTDIGGKIPKGILLVGPPGTGKTLLARAVAGEAEVPFFRMSGADFVEMFVGVGASRVRDLFKQAREKAPCIIFIDELDAIGKSRFNNIGGNDEREQTLNQLLVEMDGFDATSGLIILAATNRPDVLDPALLRPGRFDRQVLVDKPDLNGRNSILKIHTKDIKLDPEVDLAQVARGTPGFVGADLANIANEAALLAVRSGRKKVMQKDFENAIEKSVAGLEKKNRVISEKERQIVAFHETGHALVAGLTPGGDPVQKISIVPRGYGALGYTLQMPTEDRYLMTQSELFSRVDVLLAGRAAEEIVFKEISTGAANDLTKATDIIRSMITDYGMSERFKNVALTKRGGDPAAAREPALHREYAEATQQYVDEEVSRLVGERYKRVLELLKANRSLLDRTAALLLEKETLGEKEFKAILEGQETEALI